MGVPAPAPTEPPERRRLLWVSGLLNLALLVAVPVLAGLRSRPAVVAEAPTGTATRSPAASTPAGTVRHRGAGSPRAQEPLRATPWSRLASADLREFAVNLRRAECPDETVCDLLRPAIRRAYEARVVQAGFRTNFWLSGPELTAQRLQVQVQEQVLEAERDALLAELACPPLGLEELESAEADVIVALVTGFLPVESQRAMVRLVIKADRLKNQWEARTEGTFTPADLQAIAAEVDRLAARIRQEVGAAEFEEACLRFAVALGGGRSQDALAAVAITPMEFREVTRRSYLAGENDLQKLLSLAELTESFSGEERGRSGEQTRADLRQVLGEAREAEVRFREHDSYPATADWVKVHSLPANTPRVVFAELEQFRAQVAALRSQRDSDPEGVRAGLFETRAQTRARLEAILATVPEKERHEQLKNWLLQAARQGWTP